MKKPSVLQLQAFLAVVRLGSFHAAARALHLTQPSVSLRVKELESLLDARLLERKSRSVEPTREGAIAVRYAEQALGLLEELQTRLRTGDPMRGVLRVGASETVAITCLPEIIALLEDTFPDLRVELSVANSFLLCEQLASKLLDIAFVFEPDSSRNIGLEPLATAEVAWLGSALQPLPGLLRPRDLVGRKILSVPPPSPLHDVVATWCASDKQPLPKLSTCNSTAVIARLVASGVAMSVLPMCVLGAELKQGSVIRYRQREAFKPLRMFAAYPKASPGGLETVIRIARHVVQQRDFFSPFMA